MTESERQKASSEYYSELKKQLDELLKKDAELLKISEKIRNNKANFNDTAKYSEIVSNYIAKVLQENVGNISSPMGKEYVCKELLNAYYSTINDVLGKVQVSVDNQNNIHIRPQQAPFPAERVEQIAHSLEDATVPEEIIKRRSGSSVANVAKSFHDDFIKENADFRSKSGLKCYITRHSSGNCCKWCSSIAGKYSYKDAPHDVFRRHDNCNCTVTYENGRQRQNVWTKESWQVKGTSKKFQPVKLNRERAKAVQQENLQYKGSKNELTSSQNSGNINLVNNYHSGIFGDLKNKLKNIFTNKSYLPVAEEYFNDLPQKTSVYSSYEDMKATNPHYNDSYNYQINCQRCVPAYEMRRRGYNVTAKPAPDDDILGLIFEKIFVDMKWQTCSNGSGMDDIKEYMKKCGDGSRAEISLQTYEGAHLFMAEQHNGITYFIDPQNYKADAKKYFEKILIAPTRVCRIDNLKFSELIRECCEKVIE